MGDWMGPKSAWGSGRWDGAGIGQFFMKTALIMSGEGGCVMNNGGNYARITKNDVKNDVGME